MFARTQFRAPIMGVSDSATQDAGPDSPLLPNENETTRDQSHMPDVARHRELSSWDAINFLVSGVLGTALAVFSLFTLKMVIDAGLEMRKHYVRAQAVASRSPSRSQQRKGKGGKQPSKPEYQWWRAARKYRSRRLHFRLVVTCIGWPLLYNRQLLFDSFWQVMPSEGFALLLLLVALPVAGYCAHHRFRMFSFGSELDLPPGAAERDYWVDE